MANTTKGNSIVDMISVKTRRSMDTQSSPAEVETTVPAVDWFLASQVPTSSFLALMRPILRLMYVIVFALSMRYAKVKASYSAS
jgi:hypothetical protein